jgi:subtilisin family serine protease
VTSAKPGGGWQDMDGTSMATPHIAGLAALLMQARPKASVGRIERAIFESCTLDPTMPRDRANRGLPDGVRALGLLTP